MREIGADDTSIHPGFRKAIFSMSGGIIFNENGIPEAKTIFGKTVELNNIFAKYGDGMYPNEAAQATPDWQSHFWGSNYRRLYQIKLREDPDDFFTCDQCVGSEARQTSVATKPTSLSLLPAILFCIVSFFSKSC